MNRSQHNKKHAIIQILKTTSMSLISSYFILLLSMSAVSAETDDKLQLSGFARVVLGYLDESNATYLGYDNSLSLDQQSLIGLQADYQILDKLSVTGQFVARTGDDKDSELEWLYLTYTPTKSFKFKLGRQRTPIFNYSEIVDVGFAYPWVSLPQQVYRTFLFPTYEGLHVQYEYIGREILLGLETYAGGIERNFTANGQVLDTDIDNLRGVVGTIGYEGWNFRASYHRGHADVNQPELNAFRDQLQQLGFTQSAETIKTAGVGRFYQISAFYEDVDYFFRTEVIQLEADLSLAPKTKGFFVSGGVNFYPLSVYASFSKDINRYDKPSSEIPIGLIPQLDALAFGYQQIFSQSNDNNTRSYTLGLRWDWKSNLAFKTEATLLEESNALQGLFTTRDVNNFDGQAMLYQVAMEWVF